MKQIAAGGIVKLSTKSNYGKNFTFLARVLYWWEIQNARKDSIIKDNMTSQNFLDKSKLQRQIINLCLEEIDDGEQIFNKKDLSPDKTWQHYLHPTSIQPIYQAYINECVPTESQINDFKKDVEIYFNPTSDSSGSYIVPPEVWEMEILSKMGGISLSEIRKLNYFEIKKLLIVTQFINGNVNKQTNSNMPNFSNNDIFHNFNSK